MPSPSIPPPKPDLTRDRDHDGDVDLADDLAHDLDHDGDIDINDREQNDLDNDQDIDIADQGLEAGQGATSQKVGTKLGWNKDGGSWKKPDAATTQQQSQGPKVG